MIVAGLLSGTSLDGIDVALVNLRPRGTRYAYEIEAFATVPFCSALRKRILAATPPQAVSALELSALHAAIGESFGDALRAVAKDRSIDLVASHGVTLAHDGEAQLSLQLGDAFRIRERSATSVVYDFRSADTAAGGHGAPLVPYVDAILLGSDDEDRVALNLGGIANLTILSRGVAGRDVVAFDTGPANLSIGTYIALRTLGVRDYDVDGALARAGAIDETLLARMLADPFFALEPPKSTGRESFGATFIAHYRTSLDALTFADAVATLTALTVRSVAGAIAAFAPAGATVIASGGGVHNVAIMRGLAEALPHQRVTTTASFGIDPDAKEALAFALLGYELVRGRPTGIPRVTGARAPRLLGAIAPLDLDALIARVRAEEAAMEDEEVRR
jgi:anhydro-N-acetylmuramic acid kinase